MLIFILKTTDLLYYHKDYSQMKEMAQNTVKLFPEYEDDVSSTYLKLEISAEKSN